MDLVDSQFHTIHSAFDNMRSAARRFSENDTIKPPLAQSSAIYMKYRLVTFSLFIALCGCASISTVVAPGSGSAEISVSTNLLQEKNIHVLYHGSASCSISPGKMIAVINSGTLGIDGGNPVHAKVPAGGIQVISVEGLAPMREVGVGDILFKNDRDKVANEYREAIRDIYFSFESNASKTYSFQFDTDGKDISLLGFEISSDGSRRPIQSLPVSENCQRVGKR